MTVEDLLRELASDSPAPGGGSAAALAGAAAGALCAMVARLTLGREKFRDAWPAMEDLRAQSQRLSARLAELVDEDTQAYAAVVAARRMPKNTGQEQAARTAAIAEATLRAARVPLETLTLLRELAACAARALERGNPSCLTDAGSAAALVEAGATAAAYNVRVNLPGVEDPAEREALRRQALEALAAVQETVRGVEQDVDRRLG
jgi:glutamate formiminotransferase/formiminotetrahydrofolate cyclodeaminase